TLRFRETPNGLEEQMGLLRRLSEALGLLELHAVNRTFFVDPESHACLVAGDGPSASGAVLGNGARASALPGVSAAWAQSRSADAKNLEPKVQMVVSTARTGATSEISSAY